MGSETVESIMPRREGGTRVFFYRRIWRGSWWCGERERVGFVRGQAGDRSAGRGSQRLFRLRELRGEKSENRMW